MSNDPSAKLNACTSSTANDTLDTPRSCAVWRDRASSRGPISVAVTWAARSAKSMVIVPGPAPMSSSVTSGARYGSR